ncbi:hypothetical protein OI18_01805 [Flavihumibacter solisilvae]|uniref:DUF5107 domain-containing protein n=2 Tax=Flavihumibacter solisilvae TaxID=1349421 RepID=A0A0C1IQS7_9BACT|nr:hypothetical protein OI18_01805 [Flavihumibacter solisilvae]
MRTAILLVLATAANRKAAAQFGPATVKELHEKFTTYPYSDPNPIPVSGALYPYFRYDGFTTKPVQKEWKVVELENDFIKLRILPEIGGKIWTAIEKSTNRPFLYNNEVVKFRDIAMRGPWTSGGLEANFGIIGHTPNCATPVDYITRTNADGSVSCFIGVLELLSRSYWRMEINLPRDRAYFTTRVFWHNSSPLEQPYYHWMNAGLKASGNLEFIYPGNRYLGHDGEYAEWPVNNNGKKISYYEENNFGGYKSYHVFGKHAEFSGAYWHQDQMGIVRFGMRDGKAGTKIWIWGLSDQGMIWEKLLTDKNGQYVELQSGRLFNQNSEKSSQTPFKHVGFQPYATDSWIEYWYPVLQTKGMVKADQAGALNLYNEDGWLKIRFCAVQSLADTLTISSSGKVLYQKAVRLSPMQTFADSIKETHSTNDLLVTFKQSDFRFETDPKADILGRPVDAPADFDWNSAYGLYLQATEAGDQKNYRLAESRLLESLEKEKNYFPALVQLAQLYYRNFRYTEALAVAKKALAINTHDGAANYIYGLVNQALKNNVDAKDGFELAALSPEYRSAAYTQLSRIWIKEENQSKAIQYAQLAMLNNGYNVNALSLMALSFRVAGEMKKAFETVGKVLEMDPLNHLAAFEKYFANPSGENKANIAGIIRNEMPHESFLECAIWYNSAGRNVEAAKVLDMSPDTPEKKYWQAYLNNSKLHATAFQPFLSFPFRSETAEVLEKLLKKESHWQLKYHLALIFKDRNRLKEALELLQSCSDEPDFAPFYIVRSGLKKQMNDTSYGEDLEHAAKLDKDWRYSKLLTEYYNSTGRRAEALSLITGFCREHPENYIMGMLRAKTLLINRKYSETDAVLSKLRIIPFEGATEGRELYREAKLMQAIAQMQAKKYKKALQFIEEAKKWPENLGAGKPYDSEIDLRLESWLTYQCKNKMHDSSGNAALLRQITGFHPRVDNTVRNFQASNTLVTAWAYNELNEADKGREWLQQQLLAFPENKLVAWARSVFFKQNLMSLSESEKEPNQRILEALMNP